MFFLETEFPEAETKGLQQPEPPSRTADRAHVVHSVCVAPKDRIGNGDRPGDNSLGRFYSGATQAARGMTLIATPKGVAFSRRREAAAHTWSPGGWQRPEAHGGGCDVGGHRKSSDRGALLTIAVLVSVAGGEQRRLMLIRLLPSHFMAEDQESRVLTDARNRHELFASRYSGLHVRRGTPLPDLVLR